MATFGVLGPISVVGDDGAEVTLTGLRQRRLLSALLLHRGHVVSMDRLSELVWDTDALVDAAALQSLVFRLRQRVGLIELEYRAPGYILRVPNERLDAARFESLVLEAIAQRADPRRSVELLDGALELWRGDPFDDLVDSSDGQVEIDRLNELRCRALEERFELRLELGEAGIELADLEAFAAREPLRERPRHLLISAYESLGRRADGLRVYDSYRRLLADELGVAPSPALRQRHDDLLAEDDITLQPRAGSQHHRTPATIRKPTSSFIGREDLLTRTAGLLSDARLITLVGPGGVGKTRLATELVHQVDLAQIDSTIFCDLTSATDRTVTEVVMAAAAIESRADQTDLDRLVDVLRHERCCVVLDNCEHVLEQAAIVAELLVEMTDHVVVLATSRERLAVDGERLVSVPPLALSGGIDSPATRLLADRMIAVTGKPPDDDDLVSLDELARRLDGLPLALELAAARLQSLSAQEVLAGVERSIAVLRGGRRTVERHRSVDAALRWSYDLLDAATKATLRAAATFSAPFDPMDVASVMEVEHADAVDGLSALIERSMAQRDNDRFFLLHVVRRFAEECTAADERSLLEARLAVRMRSVAEALRADLRTTR
ncbi:MAG TPA: BTAD domain-containing putative transcriptional regulator, partial [Ilumatobacteraceae bacterium]|nr:BTAD domain-containing putative transcriptional regulator [Ilumatobacteraceae bacterium]